MANTGKPLTENDAFLFWMAGVVTMMICLLILHGKTLERLNALDEACGVEQVEGR